MLEVSQFHKIWKQNTRLDKPIISPPGSTWVQLQVWAGGEDSLLQWSEREVTLLGQTVLVIVLLVVREPGGLAGPQGAVIIIQAVRPHSAPSQTMPAQRATEVRGVTTDLCSIMEMALFLVFACQGTGGVWWGIILAIVVTSFTSHWKYIQILWPCQSQSVSELQHISILGSEITTYRTQQTNNVALSLI